MNKLSANRKSESAGIVKSTALPHTYAQVFNDLKIRIRQSQIKAVLSVNRHLSELYWHIGKIIVERQHAEGWGKSIVEHLAHDLHLWRGRFLAFRLSGLEKDAPRSGRLPKIRHKKVMTIVNATILEFPRFNGHTEELG